MPVRIALLIGWIADGHSRSRIVGSADATVSRASDRVRLMPIYPMLPNIETTIPQSPISLNSWVGLRRSLFLRLCGRRGVGGGLLLRSVAGARGIGGCGLRALLVG